MTVSHLYFNRGQCDASINYQYFEKNKDKEDLDIGYERNDPAFLALMDAMVLGTTTFFNYDPSTEECKSLYARM
jgi:hypothetical protein